ncbi:MAG: chromosomal replication initiator protein DnaA [Firmicutes bacterium]|nr:chromosomal replication initiator protein DnaA [Bacillota bacterium]
MRDFLGDLWHDTLKALEVELPTPSFETWIRPTHPVQMNDDVLIIGVPSEMARDTIRSRYAGVVANTVRNLTSRKVNVEFVVDADSARRHQTAAARARDARREAPEPPPQPSWDAAAEVGSPLRDRYTFDTFVVGTSNRLAHAACQAVAQNPARAYNPLFVYGGVGLGKTHLMHAIGHMARSLHPKSRVLYVTSETFTNQIITAIRDDKTAEFRARYRNIDILLIDDIQFISGKERTQEEFFHTFEALHGAQKQLVISSDRPPKDFTTLEERLRSRFEWGLITDIQPPDFETRVAILKKKAQLEGIDIPDDVLVFIARRVETNIRELEGALIRLAAHASLHAEPMTLALAQSLLKDLFPPERKRLVTIPMIQAAVAAYYGIDPEALSAKSRTRAVAFPRQVAMYLSRRLTDASLPRIGEAFGGRDHTTVLHACTKIEELMAANDELRATVAALVDAVQHPTS